MLRRARRGSSPSPTPIAFTGWSSRWTAGYLAAADNEKPLTQMAADNVKSTVHVWDVGARTETHVFSAGGGLPVSLTFSADAKALMAGFWKGPVKLWLLDGPGEAATFPGHSGCRVGLALLPDGQTLSPPPAQTFAFGMSRLAARPTASIRELVPPALRFPQTVRRFATGAGDGLLTIWDVASREELATLEGHKEAVLQLAFTPDGDYLVSVSKDQLRVWRAPSWAEIEAAEKESPRDDRK
jgi:WD40 repeat protein